MLVKPGSAARFLGLFRLPMSSPPVVSTRFLNRQEAATHSLTASCTNTIKNSHFCVPILSQRPQSRHLILNISPHQSNNCRRSFLSRNSRFSPSPPAMSNTTTANKLSLASGTQFRLCWYLSTSRLLRHPRLPCAIRQDSRVILSDRVGWDGGEEGTREGTWEGTRDGGEEAVGVLLSAVPCRHQRDWVENGRKLHQHQAEALRILSQAPAPYWRTVRSGRPPHRAANQ